METTTAPNPTSVYVLARDEGPHLHFLNNLATVKATANETGTMSAVEFNAPRGFGPPLHCHQDEDEIVVVLEGEVAFRTGDTEVIGTDGAFAFLPRAIPHTFQVLSNGARMLSVTASQGHPPLFDLMVSELGDAVSEAAMPEPGEIDPGRVAEVAAKYGIDIMGPPPAPLPELN